MRWQFLKILKRCFYHLVLSCNLFVFCTFLPISAHWFTQLRQLFSRKKTIEPVKQIVTHKKYVFPIRILLAEGDIYDRKLMQIVTQKGVKIKVLDAHKEYILNNEQLKLQAWKDKKLYINNKCLGKSLHIISLGGHLTFQDNVYPGSMWFVLRENHWYLINITDLEDYVCSVLHSESWPGWPVEVNKAFAIACRSYVLKRVMNAQKNKKIYHVKDTNIHQTYNGVHDKKTLYQAVHDTRGLVLAHDNQPIEAMFDACCGGIVPARTREFDFSTTPYLARKYACKHCASSKIYTWSKQYSTEQCVKILRDNGYKLSMIKDIKTFLHHPSGTVNYVLIQDKNKTIKISGKQFYKLTTDIKSYAYTITKQGNTIKIAGRGYGHHIGICQWGARRMIDLGKTYKEILHFYYPGVNLVKLMNGKGFHA